MAQHYGALPIVGDGLALALDCLDINSYPGSGSTSWNDISGNNVDVDEVLGELSGPFGKVDELKKVWDDNKNRWEDGLDEDNFDFVKVVKKITEDSIV